MRLLRLTLRGFRNCAQVDAELAAGVNLLAGRNAQGKSNVIEAVYVGLTGRSHRTPRDLDLIQFGADVARIRLGLETARGLEDLETVLLREERGALRRVRLNGVPVTRIAVLGRAVSVLSGPEDLMALSGAPVLRRRAVDVALAQLSPAYLHILQRYARVVHQRNRLLRRRHRELNGWDEQLMDLGARLTIRRREYLRELGPIAEEWYGIFAGRQERLRVSYLPQWAGAGEDEARRAAADALRATRVVEEARGMTLTGPHRDDVRFELDGLDVRVFGSRGQQRSVALAWKMAEYEIARKERGEHPILLLDDVFAELDEQRRERLIAALAGGQAIASTTEAGGRALRGVARRFRVEGGTVALEPCLPLFETS